MSTPSKLVPTAAHSHTFDQDRKRPGEIRTLIVIAITGVMMVVEISAGILFGSMALQADGLHMASHTAALSISAFTYIYARRHAHDQRFSFGVGKTNALGGFTGAVLLALFALLMVWESLQRLVAPVQIEFTQAIAVAFVGLLVNGVSVFILGVQSEPADGELHAGHGAHADHNLRAAYLHVIADALTSILAILALLAGRYFNAIWLDPLTGIVGAVLVSRWAFGLLRSTSHTLLDKQAPEALVQQVRAHLQACPGTRITDLHMWSIGPNLYSLALSLTTSEPRSAEDYRQRLPTDIGLAHVTIEVQHTPLA